MLLWASSLRLLQSPAWEGLSMASLNLKVKGDTNKARPASVCLAKPLLLSIIELIKNSLRKIINSTRISFPIPVFVKAPGNINSYQKEPTITLVTLVTLLAASASLVFTSTRVLKQGLWWDDSLSWKYWFHLQFSLCGEVEKQIKTHCFSF